MPIQAITEWIKTAAAVSQVAEDLKKFHAKYGQDLEYEADACATALMLDTKAGDPLRAFRAYRKEAGTPVGDAKAAAAALASGSIYGAHPPDAARETKIAEKVRAHAVAGKVVGQAEKSFAATVGNPKSAAATTK